MEKEGGWKKAKFLLLASLEKGSQKEKKKEGGISSFFRFFGEQGNGVLFCAPSNIVPYTVRTFEEFRFNSLHT